MIRKLIFQLLYYSGLITILHWINRARGRFPVLVFHRVSPQSDPFWPPLSVTAFEKILIMLKRHYQVLPLEQMLELPQKQLSRACFITFDDGFEDNYRWARPLLIKHELPAAFFIPTDALVKQQVIWPLQLRNSIFHSSKGELTLEIKGRSVLFSLKTLKDRIEAFRQLLNCLASLKEKEFLSMLNEAFNQLGKFNDEHITMMTERQVADLSNDFVVQSHTHSHFYFSALSDNRVEEELRLSKSILVQVLNGKSVRFLAYPVGDFTEEVLNQVANHYTASFAVGDTLVDSGWINDLEYRKRIPRFNIHHESASELYALVNGFHGAIKKVLKFFTL